MKFSRRMEHFGTGIFSVLAEEKGTREKKSDPYAIRDMDGLRKVGH